MRTSARARLLWVPATLALCGGLMLPAVTHAATSANDHFGVSGAPALPNPLRRASLVIDPRGTEHVIGIKRVIPNNASDDEYQLESMTRRNSAKHWTHRLGAGGPLPENRYGRMFVTESTNEKKIDVLAGQCASGLVTTQISMHAVQLPKPVLAFPADTFQSCNGGGVEVWGAVSLPHNKVEVLLVDDSDVAGGPGPMVAIGTPGKTFGAPVALPDPQQVGALYKSIVRDPVTGEVTVVGGKAQGLYVWTKKSGGAWSGPTSLRTVAASYDFASVTAYGGRITLGLVRSRAFPASTMALVSRNPAGHWSRPSAIPHTTLNDENLDLVANPTNGHLHAVFTRSTNNLGSDGVQVEVRSGGSWSRPKFLTHSVHDTALDIRFDPQGHTVVLYQYLY
jgi:hypothetical protein